MFKDILVFMFSFTLLIILFVFCLFLGFRNFLTTENITNSLKKTDFTALYKDSSGNDTEIISSFKVLLEQSGVPENSVEEIANSKETKEFIGEIVGSSIEATINGKDEALFKDEDVVKLVKGNMYIIEKNLETENIKMNEQVEKEILDLVSNNAYILTENMPTTKEIITMTGNDKINELVSASRLLLSKNTFNNFLIVISINIIILVLLRLKKLRFLKTLSAPLIINFILLLIISLGFKNQLSNFILNSSNTFKLVFYPFIDSLFNMLFKYGIFSFGIGILLIVIYQIQRKVLS